MVRIFKFLIFLFLLIFLFNENINAAKLFLYLNIERKVLNYSIFIKKIEFVSRSGKRFSFKINKKFSSNRFFNQDFIKKINIPQGIYVKSIIFLKEEKISLPLNLKISNEETQCLFVVWNVRASIQNKRFYPVLYLKKQEIPLRGEILFITSPEENTLFFIRTDLNQVCASLRIDGYPVEMALSCNDDKIFVLTKLNKTIYSVEVSTFRISDEFVLPFVVEPEYLIKANNKLIIVDPNYNKVISIDSESGNLIGNIQIGENLTDIVYSEKVNKFFLSSYQDQQIYVLNDNLQTISSIQVNCSPISLFLLKNYLYVSGSSCNTVFVYNILNYLSVKKLNFYSPFKIVYINTNMFVAEYQNKFIDIKYPEQFSPSKKINLSIIPFNLSACERRGWLYVSSRTKKYIEVIDILREQVVGKIFLGAFPYDIKVGRSKISCQ